MERRKSAPKGAKKRAPTDQATTALGAVPEKRGLKKAPGTKLGAKKDAVAASGGGQREMRVNLKTAKGRKVSSTLWLERQLNDPFVSRAKAEGYRSRAAYKLKELNEKFGLIKKGSRVVDLGCAPGGWLQAAVEAGATRVVGIDYLPMPHVPGTDHLELDFLDDAAPDDLKSLLGGGADVVLSDMAAPTTGHKTTDHLRIIALAEVALDFATDVLAPGGGFVCKVFQGGAEGELLQRLKQNFSVVKHAKPKSSRADSAEVYVVATGFKGRE
jgi:23S rRNA (uridine2552-2'-O)-methyltransferase